MHASKGLEPNSHKRLSTILEEEIPEEFRSEIVVVSGPSHAEETIVRDITLITAASKDLETAQYVQALFSNHYFRLYTNTECHRSRNKLARLKISLLLVQVPCMDLAWRQCKSCHYHARACRNYSIGCSTWSKSTDL